MKTEIVNAAVLGPRNKKEDTIFAEEKFRIGVQVTITGLMRSKGVSEEQLALRLGWTTERLNKVFEPQCRVTIRQLARIFHVLGEEAVLTCDSQKWSFKD